MSSSPIIDATELNELKQAGPGPRLIDVRTPAEFETAHIPEPRHMKIFRNRPGEILTQYENFALCALYGGGIYGH